MWPLAKCISSLLVWTPSLQLGVLQISTRFIPNSFDPFPSPRWPTPLVESGVKSQQVRHQVTTAQVGHKGVNPFTTDITSTEKNIQVFIEFTLGNGLATFATPLGGHGSSEWMREYHKKCFISCYVCIETNKAKCYVSTKRLPDLGNGDPMITDTCYNFCTPDEKGGDYCQ